MLKSAGHSFNMSRQLTGKKNFTAQKERFEKQCTLPADLIPLLRGRGLLIADEAMAVDYLTHIGYFRLSAYFRPLYRDPKSRTHEFRNGATFERAMELYRFDRKLRLAVFNEIEKIEVALRGALSNTVSDGYKDVFWITKKESYDNRPYTIKKKNGELVEARFDFEDTLGRITGEIDKSKEDFIKQFRKRYGNPYPPAWMIVEILPFGSLCMIYRNIRDNGLQKQIAGQFDLPVGVFSNWFEVLTNLRNMCCHHARMWDKEISIDPAYPKNRRDHFVSNEDGRLKTHNLYIRLAIIKYLLGYVSPANTFTQKLKNLFERYNPDLAAMGFPADWESEPVWA
jgi:abortive infection bacteriophage resistance protein